MQNILNPLTQWTEALSRCLLNEQDYKKLSQRVLKYFLDNDTDKLQIFFKTLEQHLKSKRTGIASKWRSLLFLRDGSEKKSRNFAETLGELKDLLHAVYQIAASGSVLSKDETNIAENDLVHLAIECVLYWRLHFGESYENTGEVYQALFRKALQDGIEFPKSFKFFSQDSSQAIQNLFESVKESSDDVSSVKALKEKLKEIKQDHFRSPSGTSSNAKSSMETIFSSRNMIETDRNNGKSDQILSSLLSPGTAFPKLSEPQDLESLPPRNADKLFTFNPAEHKNNLMPLMIPQKNPRERHAKAESKNELEYEKSTPGFRKSIQSPEQKRRSRANLDAPIEKPAENLLQESGQENANRPQQMVLEPQTTGFTSPKFSSQTLRASKGFSSPFNREMAEIAKSIEISQQRTRLIKSPRLSRPELNSMQPESSKHISVSQSEKDLHKKFAEFNLNILKELETLKATTSALREENSELKKELTELKTVIKSPENKTNSPLDDGPFMFKFPSHNSLESNMRSPTSLTSPSQADRESESGSQTRKFTFQQGKEIIVENGRKKTILKQKAPSDYNSPMSLYFNSPVSSNSMKNEPTWANVKQPTLSILRKRIATSDNLAHDTGFTETAPSRTEGTPSTQQGTPRANNLPKSPVSLDGVQSPSSISLKTQGKEMASPVLQSVSLVKSSMEVRKIHFLEPRKTMLESTKPMIEARKPITKTSKQKTSLKTTESSLFRQLSEKLETKKALNSFKRASLRAKGRAAENEALIVDYRLSLMEDLKNQRRLAKVSLSFENVSDLHIQKFSVLIRASSSLFLIREPDLKKPSIKPGKSQQLDFVVGIGETHLFTHLAVDCKFEQVVLQKDGNRSMELTVLVPVTYFNFMEGLPKQEDEDISFLWSSKCELGFQSSGKFKVDKGIVQSEPELLEIFPHASLVSGCESENVDTETKRTYVMIVETEKLGVFIYLLMDWFSDSNEINFQVASGPDYAQKGAFLIQTLTFLFCE